MTEIDKILVENFKETLRQFQNYLVWGIGSSLSFLILSITNFGSANVNVPLPGSFVPINPEFAKIISLSICWTVGALATYACERAVRISIKLQNNPDLLHALLTFPSIATEIYLAVRLLAALIPGVFILIGRIYDWKVGGEPGWQIFSTVMLLAPYLTLALQLTYLSLPVEKPIRLKSKE